MWELEDFGFPVRHREPLRRGGRVQSKINDLQSQLFVSFVLFVVNNPLSLVYCLGVNAL
jgi:hypothetical protein